MIVCRLLLEVFRVCGETRDFSTQLLEHLLCKAGTSPRLLTERELEIGRDAVAISKSGHRWGIISFERSGPVAMYRRLAPLLSVWHREALAYMAPWLMSRAGIQSVGMAMLEAATESEFRERLGDLHASCFQQPVQLKSRLKGGIPNPDLLDDIALLYMTEHPSALRGARSGFRLYVTEKLINGSGIASVQIGSRALLEQLAGNDSVASLLQVQTQLVPECLVFLRKLKPLLGIEDYVTCERVLSELTTGDTQHALC